MLNPGEPSFQDPLERFRPAAIRRVSTTTLPSGSAKEAASRAGRPQPLDRSLDGLDVEVELRPREVTGRDRRRRRPARRRRGAIRRRPAQRDDADDAGPAAPAFTRGGCPERLEGRRRS
jgi:hypothetical protein